MSWIEQVSEEQAEGRLDGIYKSAIGRAGRVAHIIKLMSLRPKLLGSFMRFYGDLMMDEDSPLSRGERELIATVTSKANSCHY